MANDWQDDKKWSDKFLPEIKSTLGIHLIGEPPMEEDAERNTDLMVLKMEAVRIGCRVRTNWYLSMHDYKSEFTIRERRPYGAKTELTKVIEGWGDYFFYGFADDADSGLAAWTLADLSVFRLWFNRELATRDAGSYPGESFPNKDNSSSFRVFRWDDLPQEFIIAQKKVSHEQAP